VDKNTFVMKTSVTSLF